MTDSKVHVWGLPNTECKIEGCSQPVWPSKALWLCNKHYQRYKRGRMEPNGELISPFSRHKNCEECGKSFKLKFMERHVRWCLECRPIKYAEGRKRYAFYGPTIRMEKPEKFRGSKYIKKVLSKLIKECEKKARYRKKHSKILKLRCEGSTYQEIANIYECSRQNIQQICKANMK